MKRPRHLPKSIAVAFCGALLLLYGCSSGSSGDGGGLPGSDERELVSQAYGIFQQYYFEPSLVREPLETDTLETYVDSYRSPADIYTRYFDAPVTAALREELVSEEDLIVRIYEPGVLYIAFDSFDPGISRRVIQGVDDGIAKGAGTLILDLRINVGGRVDEATALLDYFSADRPEGTVMCTTEGPDPAVNRVFRIGDTRGLNGTETRFDKNNMYVLTSGLTASATEILVAGLVIFDESTQVGSTTFGKNRLLIFFRTARGDAFNLTAGRIYHADGVDREGIGISPETGESTSPFADVAGIVGVDDPDPLQPDWGISNQFLSVLYDKDFWRESTLAAGLRPSTGPFFRSWINEAESDRSGF
jgi:hypothetical protein